MPILLLLALIPALLLFVLLLIPIGVVMRYRVASSRRRAYAWLAALQVWAFVISGALLLVSVLIASIWEPQVAAYSFMGVLGGLGTGVLALRLTRWENEGRRTFMTTNRWIVLIVTVGVSARVLYGFALSIRTGIAALGGESFASPLLDAGVAGSMAAAAVFVCYQLVFWAGVRRRLTGHRGG